MYFVTAHVGERVGVGRRYAGTHQKTFNGKPVEDLSQPKMSVAAVLSEEKKRVVTTEWDKTIGTCNC